MSRASRPAGRAAIALVAALATAADAQERPVFPADVELATLDVTVLDSNGQPVALAKVGGRGRMRSRSLSLTEALSFVEREESSLWQAAVERECPGGRELCISDLQSQAHDVVSEHRYKSEGSFAMLAAIFKQLEPVAARKVMVLVSQGLSLPDAGTIARPTPRLRELATAAARARGVLRVARPRRRGPGADLDTSRDFEDDRSRNEQGLEALAGMANGTVLRGAPVAAFERLAREISDTTWSASSLPRRTGPAPRATCASPPTGPA
jgi:hypothetical protein